MNYVNIMYDLVAFRRQIVSYSPLHRNYDVWGASATPGPNAPLGDLCGTSKQPQANAEAALKQWTAAGFPASKLLLGLPLYGYVSQSSKTVLTGSSLPTTDMLLLDKRMPLSSSKHLTFGLENPSEETLGIEQPLDHDGMYFLNGTHSVRSRLGDFKADAINLSSWWGQQIPFNALVKAGALVKQSDGSYDQGGGFTKDTDSLGSKATFAKQHGIAGCFTWSLDQDDGLTLQNAIRKSLGK
ncbi:hypothetical protein H0H92_010576 [Tricholoma furcatifolium]|nr:hypothetical protein H0H92_010576 [Tricholoma furcatifolium]